MRNRYRWILRFEGDNKTEWEVIRCAINLGVKQNRTYTWNDGIEIYGLTTYKKNILMDMIELRYNKEDIQWSLQKITLGEEENPFGYEGDYYYG